MMRIGARVASLLSAGALLTAGWTHTGVAQQAAGTGTPETQIATASHDSWEPVEGSHVALLTQRVSLDLRQATVRQALEEIARRAGVGLSYDATAVPAAGGSVSLHVTGMTMGAVLSQVLLGTGLRAYVAVDGRDILIRHAPPGRSPGAKYQGTGRITGHVTDGILKSPLAQATVSIDGTASSTTANADGQYVLAGVAPGTYHVTARRVGYQPLTRDVTIAADQSVRIDFALTAAPTRLDEVVTTAVGEQRRYQVGNEISTINADSIAPTAPITSLTDLISARAPGVEVREMGGLTGSGEAIRIRGQSSIVTQGDPILIVDGVRQDNSPGEAYSQYFTAVPAPSRLNDLDFSQIETIDVLKGPAASTEYGTDAANGVIVITTKRGAVGRPVWDASAEQTTSGIPVTFPEYYYSWGHTTDPSHTPIQCPLISGSGGPTATAGSCAVDSVTQFNPLDNPQYSIYGPGNRQRYTLSVGGGSESLRYYVAGGLSNEAGILRLPPIFRPTAESLGYPASSLDPNGEDQRSVRTTTSIRLGPTADLAVTGAYLSTYQTTPAAGYLTAGPTFGITLPDSAHAYGYGYPFYSPLAEFAMTSTEQSDRLTGGMTANWRPTTWLQAHGTVGIDHGSLRMQGLQLPQAYQYALGEVNSGALDLNNATTDIYSADVRVSATAAVTHMIRSVTSVGAQLVDSRTQGVTGLAVGLSETNLTLNGAPGPTVYQAANRQATLGGYGEEELSFADRLFLTGALRIDAGSGFGGDYSTAAYPKASVSWLALSSSPTTVRVRAAFGESGVQPYNGAAFQLYMPTTQWIGGGLVSTVNLNAPGNPLLQPERSVEYEGGVDLGFFKSHVSLDLTGYSKTTDDALVDVSAGWDLGGVTYEENVGQVRNTGIEAALNASLIATSRITWDVTVNASVNHNKLIQLAPHVMALNLGYPGSIRGQPGYPLYGYWGTKTTFTDANHDGVIEPNEVTLADSESFLGSSVPTRETSISTHVGILGGALTVGALLDYRGGFRLLNYDAGQASFNSMLREENDSTAPLWQQARSAAGPAAALQGSLPAGFYEDATYLRFRELSVTWSLPRAWLRAVRARNLSLTGAVRNLALWTSYTGPDPEVSGTYGTNVQYRFSANTSTINNNVRADAGSVPLARYWVLRVNAGL